MYRCLFATFPMLFVSISAIALTIPVEPGNPLPRPPADFVGQCAPDLRPEILPDPNGGLLACGPALPTGPSERPRTTLSCPTGFVAVIDRTTRTMSCQRRTTEVSAPRCMIPNHVEIRSGVDVCVDLFRREVGPASCNIPPILAGSTLVVDHSGARDECVRVVIEYAKPTVSRTGFDVPSGKERPTFPVSLPGR